MIPERSSPIFHIIVLVSITSTAHLLMVLFSKKTHSKYYLKLPCEQSPSIFLDIEGDSTRRVQPCSPVVIGSLIHYMLLLNVEVHFLRTLAKGMQILVNSDPLTNIVVIAM